MKVIDRTIRLAKKRMAREKINHAKKLVDEGEIRVSGMNRGYYEEELVFEVDDDQKYEVKLGGGRFHSECEKVGCNCKYFKDNQVCCEHILAAMQYVENQDMTDIEQKFNEAQVLQKIIEAFSSETAVKKNGNAIDIKDVKIVPKINFSIHLQEFNFELKIGQKQMYKIKDVVELYENMQGEKTHKYGAKLEFTHKRSSFDEESLPILDYVLKRAEVIKEANESIEQNSYYGYGRQKISAKSIPIPETEVDAVFDLFENKIVAINTDDGKDLTLEFTTEEADIKFIVEKAKNDMYSLKLDSAKGDEFSVIMGNKYGYVMKKHKFHRCQKNKIEKVQTILDILRNNGVGKVTFHKKDLEKFLTFLAPQMKDQINLSKVSEEDLNKYMPKDLGVKVFLDIDKKNNIVADVKFEYGDFEFNPYKQENITIPRILAEEKMHLDTFERTRICKG